MHRVCRTSQRNAEGAFDCGASADMSMSTGCRGAARAALEVRCAVREVEAKCAALLQSSGLGDLVRTYRLHWTGPTRLDVLQAEVARLERLGFLWHDFLLVHFVEMPSLSVCMRGSGPWAARIFLKKGHHLSWTPSRSRTCCP